MNGGLWLSRTASGACEYGPVSLAELREMVAAGLIAEDTLVRDAGSAPRDIAQWPELMAALNTPTLKVWRQAVSHRGLVNASGELRMGAVVFDRVNEPGATPAPEALGVLAINRAHEPERIVVMPPWYRWPWWRNFVRWLGVSVPVTVLYVLLSRRSGAWVFNASFTLTAYMVWGWFVWVLHPRRWDGSDA